MSSFSRAGCLCVALLGVGLVSTKACAAVTIDENRDVNNYIIDVPEPLTEISLSKKPTDTERLNRLSVLEKRIEDLRREVNHLKAEEVWRTR